MLLGGCLDSNDGDSSVPPGVPPACVTDDPIVSPPYSASELEQQTWVDTRRGNLTPGQRASTFLQVSSQILTYDGLSYDDVNMTLAPRTAATAGSEWWYRIQGSAKNSIGDDVSSYRILISPGNDRVRIEILSTSRGSVPNETVERAIGIAENWNNETRGLPDPHYLVYTTWSPEWLQCILLQYADHPPPLVSTDKLTSLWVNTVRESVVGVGFPFTGT